MIRFAVKLGLLVLLSFVGQCPQAKSEEKQPTYICRIATGPIKIDGQLNEPSWEHAQTVSVFYPFRPKNTANLPATTARLLWDESSLYLAWRAEDTDIWSYSNKNDDKLWRGDIVEFYAKPNAKEGVFYEIDIAPNGAIYDGCYPSRGSGGFARFKKWSSKARIATQIDGTDDNWHDQDKGYTVEAAIPLSAFGESSLPKAGSKWTFGLFRCDYTSTYDSPLLFSSLPGKLDATHGFHSYEQYQPLRFEGQESTKK